MTHGYEPNSIARRTGPDSILKHQIQLLQQARVIYRDSPISQTTEQAFLAVPRHAFVTRYRLIFTKEWQEVTDENLHEHLGQLYNDAPLCLYGDDDDDIPSTISQPSFVLRSLDMLQLRPGQKVFELGTGSGWNASLMAQLVGLDGHVYSVELIPELASRANAVLRTRRIGNVTVIVGDGGDGYAAGAPYDRATFTAGTYDLPRQFYGQMKDDGLLLVGIKSEGGGDNLFLLRKRADHFESVEAMPCGWVQMKGKHQIESANPQPIETLPQWNDFQQREVSRIPYWWNVKGREHFVWATAGIRSFLGITEPGFRTFKLEKTPEQPHEERYFGLLDQHSHSLAVAKHDCIIAYGNAAAKERLMQRLRQWMDLGMPTGASFNLHVYPADVPLAASDNQWIVKRRESQFLWSLAL
jgi:protein-L-isoaspartate(D-aspartate) O-methyltransferase